VWRAPADPPGAAWSRSCLCPAAGSVWVPRRRRRSLHDQRRVGGAPGGSRRCRRCHCHLQRRHGGWTPATPRRQRRRRARKLRTPRITDHGSASQPASQPVRPCAMERVHGRRRRSKMHALQSIDDLSGRWWQQGHTHTHPGTHTQAQAQQGWRVVSGGGAHLSLDRTRWVSAGSLAKKGGRLGGAEGVLSSTSRERRGSSVRKAASAIEHSVQCRSSDSRSCMRRTERGRLRSAWTSASLSGRFHPQFRDKNRRDIGKSQSVWTDPKMETPSSREVAQRVRQRVLGAPREPQPELAQLRVRGRGRRPAGRVWVAQLQLREGQQPEPRREALQQVAALAYMGTVRALNVSWQKQAWPRQISVKVAARMTEEGPAACSPG
jgi:hypothetical protein